jgi:uncharacterized membrane protein YfcA
VSLAFASAIYVQGKLIDFKTAVPITVAAVVLSPLGARATLGVDQRVLLWIFAGFLVFAGWMMLFYRPKSRAMSRDAVAIAVGAGLGGAAGFVGGLLGVGGGNIVLPFLNWLGLDAKVAAGTTAFIVVFFPGWIPRAHLARRYGLHVSRSHDDDSRRGGASGFVPHALQAGPTSIEENHGCGAVPCSRKDHPRVVDIALCRR